MQPTRVERRLAAILVADIVAYSSLVEADEARTLASIRALRSEIIEPLIAGHRGRIVKLMGDGAIVEYGSAVDAVACAVAVQQGVTTHQRDVPLDRRIVLRIGINVGDVVVEDGDLLGDGVNVAARLEPLAEPGGICIADTVQAQLAGRTDQAFEDMGERTLKNIAKPLRVWRWAGQQAPAARPVPLPLPDKPSIAVLPFDNLGGDPEQTYFADGIVEEIITSLAHFRHLFVIARNSSFAYKGRPIDVKQAGRELGVRYLVEGSVRRAGERLRITGQLIDASTGAHLWADRFDGTSAEIFDLQDQVASRIVGAINPRVQQAEIERAKRKPTDSLDAYDYYLRGLAVINRTITKSVTDDALLLFKEALARDPEFALAHAWVARCYSLRKINSWMEDRSEENAEAILHARKAIDIGRDDAVALSYGGFVLGYVTADLERAASCIGHALVLNPSLAAAWGYSSWTKTCQGDPETAIQHAAIAMRLSPLDTNMFAWEMNIGLAHFCAGNYADAVTWAERTMQHQPYASAIRLAAASYAQTGRLEQAHQQIAHLRQFDPALRISNLAEVLPPFGRPDDRTRYVEALRMAGLPE